jgi:curved DNA-binding protein CbpA
MPQPQGPRSFDPYRILQLQPHTSHDLIVESYWTLVARAKAHGNDAAIRALNAAYELLTNAERRTTHDREHGYAPVEPEPADTRKHKNGKNGSRAALDHYTLLAVHPSADLDVIELAYRIGMRKAAGYHPDLVLLREQLTEAFQILSSPELRTKYNTSMGLAASENGASEAASSEAAETDGGVPGFLSSKEKPGGDAPKAPRKRGLFGLFDRGDAARPDNGRRSDHAPSPARIADEAARGERLLQLRPFGAEVLAGAMRRPPVRERPPMAALSVVGPLGEERVPLPPRTITIGSSDENDIVLPGRRVAREQARLWPHGDSFAMRVTGRGPVRVSGAEPMLAVVLLEDGDQIEISEYRLTFHNSPRE